MQTEIKIVDESSKLVNWKRIDYLMMRCCRSILIMAATVFGLGYLFKGLAWWVGV